MRSMVEGRPTCNIGKQRGNAHLPTDFPTGSKPQARHEPAGGHQLRGMGGLSLSLALRVTTIFRMTAAMATIGFLPLVTRRL
jgi:hypothetical protein